MMIRPMNKKNSAWFIITMAAMIAVIHAVLLHLYGLEVYESPRYAWDKIESRVLDCLIVCGMLWAWRLRKSRFAVALLLSTASVAGILNTRYSGSALVVYLILLLTPLVTWSLQWALEKKLSPDKAGLWAGRIWLAAAFILLLLKAFELIAIAIIIAFLALESYLCLKVYAKKSADPKVREVRLWLVWLGLAGLFFELHVWPWPEAFLIRTMEAVLPIVCAALLQFMDKRKWNEAIKLTVYYALCLYIARNYVYGVVGFVMPILICAMEARSRKERKPWQRWLGVIYAFVFGGAYLGYYYRKFTRLREIIFHLGGPAVNIQPMERVNWLGYKMAAVKCYFTGNTAVFSEADGLPYVVYTGYQKYYDELGALTYRCGWWWLILMTLLAVAVAVVLLRRKSTSPNADRYTRYMGVSYLLRAFTSFMYIVTLTPKAGTDFPFLATNIMDLLILGLLLRQMKE